MPSIYETTPPPLGHRMKEFFMMDPELVNLNNGAHGCTPKVVFDRATKLAEESEWNTDYFHYITYLPLLDSVRENLAKLIGAKTNECVLVPNASMGMNTLLRNIDWEEGDTIILTTTTYSSVSLTAVNLNDAPPHPKLSVFKLDFPNSGPAEILDGFRKHIQSVPKVPNKKRVALLDTITSLPGCALPWKEMVKICKEEGVFSAVDAAHSIGHELNINLTEIGPDFWVSNCHKWLMSKRSVAVMYVPERNQHIVRCSIPTSDKYVSPQNRVNPTDSFVKQYDWTSTIDLAPYLSVDEALRFRAWIGGEEKINDYCHNLAIEGGKRLAQVLGTKVLDPDGVYTLNMVNVELPFDLKPTPEIDMAFKRKLLGEKKAYSTHCFHNGRWWARASAQVWNEIEDFEILGKAWLEVIEEVKTEFKDAEKVPAHEF